MPPAATRIRSPFFFILSINFPAVHHVGANPDYDRSGTQFRHGHAILAACSNRMSAACHGTRDMLQDNKTIMDGEYRTGRISGQAMIVESALKPGRKWLLWTAGLLLLLAGFAGGIAAYMLLTERTEPERISFAEYSIPAVMTHPLGRDGALRHRIGRWKVLTSPTSGNDSLVLQYGDTYIASFSVDSSRDLKSVVLSHPLHDAIVLVLDELNRRNTSGKLTVDILSVDGQKVGFVIDENMDGQPNLRFEYAGPYLYVWLDNAWHRVMRTSPRLPGERFTHTVMYRGRLHQIFMEEFPYRLEPLNGQ